MQGIECILLVDDDPITNYINQLLLERMGFTEEKIAVTTDGNEAVEIISTKNEKLKKNQTFLLFFLDINMPVMDGFEVLDTLKERGISLNQIFVYLLSSSKSAKDLKKANHYTIRGFIDKPLKEESIRAIVKELGNSGHKR
ncbi:response regulator [Catalinimonas niigatensis]|uniref:response regulator n=1 Tax=Catalinimonas niigatensis TaxID=1397264 RepID=UPI002664F894|nr:response regulator [Catalinimonas niigatensis]WPP49307.1 response regulator [Catalinimonas niigatensis]